MISRADIVTEARRWLGTPWKHQAALRGVGADCIGLIAGVADALRIEEAAYFLAAHEFRSYGREPDPEMLLRGCARFLDERPVRAALPGDVLLLRFKSHPQHFALLSANEPRMIHAYAQARKVVEHRLDAIWAARVVRAFSLRGVA